MKFYAKLVQGERKNKFICAFPKVSHNLRDAKQPQREKCQIIY